MPKPIVALVGRPNVGKSTLFNRVAGQRLAIVEDLPGTTRDRQYADAEWTHASFTLVDTGGLDLGTTSRASEAIPRPAEMVSSSSEFRREIRQQAEIAIAEADAIIFLVDARDGITAGDMDVAEVLRQTRKPVIVAANKADSEERRLSAVEFYELGLGEPFPISAIHGIGVGDLLDAVVEQLPVVAEEEDEDALKIAIVGRPNVGKSSLLNKILGQDRAIVSTVPGTTRDAIDTELQWHGERIVLIDTAGIRRRGRIERGAEKYSVIRALRAVQRADVVALLIDATQGVTAQDSHIAGYVLEEWKSIMVLVNKWDAVAKDSHTMHEFTQRVRADLKFLDYVPVLFISALTGQRVGKVIPLAQRISAERQVRIPTSQLNKMLQDAIVRHQPPSKGGKRLRFLYATQPETSPPTFVVFVNDHRLVHFSYQRYLENRIRELYRFEGTPIKLLFRSRGES